MATSPSNEEDAPLDSFEKDESSSNGKGETGLDQIEEGESAPDSREEPEHLVPDELKHAAVWFLLQILGAMIEYWIILILNSGHGPAW